MSLGLSVSESHQQQPDILGCSFPESNQQCSQSVREACSASGGCPHHPVLRDGHREARHTRPGERQQPSQRPSAAASRTTHIARLREFDATAAFSLAAQGPVASRTQATHRLGGQAAAPGTYWEGCCER